VQEFVAAHDRVYVIEQNRDAQLESLLKLDLTPDQVVKLRSILHYNGLPMDAQSVTSALVTREGL
jgi:2-oxoglutarate ferredoxin oxidoreductase subunit alpha